MVIICKKSDPSRWENYFAKCFIFSFANQVHVDAVTNTGFIIDSFGLHSSLEDLVFHDIEEYSNNLAPGSLRAFSRYSDHGICKSYFEGYSSSSNSSPGFCGRKPQDKRKELSVNTRHAVRNSSYCHGATYFIIRGLMLPLFGLRLAWNLALACWRCSFYYIRCTQIQVRSIASRVYKTLHGSSGDIGWLQHTPGMDPVEDGTPRFIELLTKRRNGGHTLPDSYVYLLIPGLFSNHSPLYFVGTRKFFSKMGLACHIAIIHSEASVQQNAWELKQYIEELYWGSGKQVMLLGHSKGGVDAAAALSIYWCDLKDKVAGLALVQSPYGGSPLASDILREGQIADKETRRIMELLICKLIKGDIRALEDLTYERRGEFIMNHRLPKEIPLISFHSEASVGAGVLATMTHIAHAELPWLPLPKFGSEEYDNALQAGRQVPVVIPLSAAMAVCALHLQLRYGEKSDGLVTCRDAEVPGSVVVRPDKKLDHAWMVYSAWKRDPSEPESFEMCEALLTMLVELGKIKQEKDMRT
ncbi:hypothetical protein K2173_015878 [Erythroxylum novogranatense]|uniref:Alpha/beta-Hydrolases superfamily protein n=1 Tax=Erythroxylum novogranatense TaxID=1862640 RepID=A0AAV8SEL6_9ROSI|nr:hypothetical protein K2173_015878 [Erythroxylum novogranatense]